MSYSRSLQRTSLQTSHIEKRSQTYNRPDGTSGRSSRSSHFCAHGYAVQRIVGFSKASLEVLRAAASDAVVAGGGAPPQHVSRAGGTNGCDARP